MHLSRANAVLPAQADRTTPEPSYYNVTIIKNLLIVAGEGDNCCYVVISIFADLALLVKVGRPSIQAGFGQIMLSTPHDQVWLQTLTLCFSRAVLSRIGDYRPRPSKSQNPSGKHSTAGIVSFSGMNISARQANSTPRRESEFMQVQPHYSTRFPCSHLVVCFTKTEGPQESGV